MKMKVKKCNFTEKSQIYVAVLPSGSLLIGDANTGGFYKITSVKPFKYKKPKGTKKVKIKIPKKSKLET